MTATTLRRTVSRRDTGYVTPRHGLCHAVTGAVSRRGTDKATPWHRRPCGVLWQTARLLVIAAVPFLTACGERGRTLLPPSGGRLYEVLLVGDRDDIVRDALQQDTPGLPQAEPQFDVSAIDSGRFNQSVSMARNIVMVHVNPQLCTSLRLRYEKDVWAQPQMVIHVNAPSVTMLRDSIGRIAPTLLRLLNRSELNKATSLLRTKRNAKAEKLVRQMFGITMWIPLDMTATKRGKDFLWLSNNSPTTMKNIVVYKDWAPAMTANGRPYYYSEEPARFVKARDNMLGRNIKGETDSMHMATAGETVGVWLTFRSEQDRRRWLHDKRGKAQPIPIYRGLWEMTGDDMGGPFVSRTLPMARGERQGLDGCGNIVVEGFVFAPGKKKRNAIHELEAALYTIK